MKFCQTCGIEIDTRDGENRCRTCDDAENLAQRRKQTARAKREREQAMRDLGLVKVRGAMGGVYWE